MATTQVWPIIMRRTTFKPVWINGQQTTVQADVVGAIAAGLANARNPLIVVDAIDLAGAAEAVSLTRTAGGTIDHSSPENISLLQEHGWLGTTPGEAVLRADAVLLVGPLPEQIATDEALRRLCDSDKQRTFRYVGSEAPPNAIANLVGKGLAGADLGHISLAALVGAVRAHVTEHAFQTPDDASRAAIAALGDWMKNATYGVAVFATGALSDLEGHALLGLLDDLSLKTRWNGLALAVPAGQNELQRMSASLTGLPAPLAFEAEGPSHDRWRHSARAMIKRGECDTAVWISSSDNPLPEWLTGIPNLYAICARDAALTSVKAQAAIGVAGVDYAAILEPAEIGAFAAIAPPDISNRGSAACVIGAVRTALEAKGAAA